MRDKPHTPTRSALQQHHACIMIECGCSVEDVAITFQWTIPHALYVVAQALKHNTAARRFARKHHGNTKVAATIPSLHRGRSDAGIGRIAA